MKRSTPPESTVAKRHLVSTRPQSVGDPGAGEFVLTERETIGTEISGKDHRSAGEIFASGELEMKEW